MKTANIKKMGWYGRLPLRHKQGLWGMVFLFPWLLGFILFFGRPMWETVRYSFSEVEVGLGFIDVNFIGWENYRTIFTVDPHFNRFILTLTYQALPMVIIVVIFSLLSAILINGKFFGRGIVRAVFFIPIIMGANIAQAVIVGDDAITQATTADVGFGGFTHEFFIRMLTEVGLPTELIGFVTAAIAGIFSVLAQSGVPILIFLAGLQAIPVSMYEVATIEGSTQYETFWKVTMPMISPMILLSTVFTITDLFARHSISGVPNILGGGSFLQYIRVLGFLGPDYGLASAMVVVYILACMAVIFFISWLMSRVVFYYD